MTAQVDESTTSLNELVEHLDDLIHLAVNERFTEFAILLAEARLSVLRCPSRFARRAVPSIAPVGCAPGPGNPTPGL